MYSWDLPTSLNVGGRNYKIRTDYRVILDILTAMNDPDIFEPGMTEEEKQAAEEKEKQESYEVVPDTNTFEKWPQGPNVYGASAVVMDMDSKAVLYGKKIDERHYPASITKLLTTLVALENGELTDTITFSEDSVSFLEYGDASIGMTPGEILTLDEALYGILLASDRKWAEDILPLYRK